MRVREAAALAKAASREMRLAHTAEKNAALEAMASAVESAEGEILTANAQDIASAKDSIAKVMLDRLSLTPARVSAMAAGLREIAALPDPIGAVDRVITRPNGLKIAQTRVPLGLIGIICESRPNVTADAAALCVKAGSAVLLRGGKEALQSNIAITKALRSGLAARNLPPDAVALVTDTARESAREMMELSGVLDVLIPRGGAALIRTVAENARVPVIATGAGVCHVYVDAEADMDMALPIAVTAKCSRPSVCNACETLLVHAAIAPLFLPSAAQELTRHGVELRGCEKTLAIIGGKAVPASEEDWATEYNDLILSVRVVASASEAAEHINRYGTGHSEAIVTKNIATARRFCEWVDSACVYINASTRFTDGGEFGFGGEIGISTQKLHARGPMGLEHLTSVKYIIEGEGQTR
ncbi:MAG: glutamate-5-semialdehyde dehydrogenase [Oscillospiraceae bacterium]|jgi:glutamate-5-semialdehyde dehydrogenase|nr:glutamate-5-semialdehyde dehydrogenase [Oscillospiraceae bacterium]